tara:strand:- start:111 stop:689 length:579 start_codon:yes stop_codon:yes gene_type:complete
MSYKTYYSGIPLGGRGSSHKDSEMGSNQEPWYTRKSIEFLVSILTPEMDVLEYGCGSSTVWFSQRVKSITTIEHDAGWKNLVEKTLSGRANVRLLNIPLGEAYVNIVNTDDLIKDKQYDLVCIDGRLRSRCILECIDKVKSGGYLLLDNSERPRYLDAWNQVPTDWEFFTFPGPGIAACGTPGDITRLAKKP